MQARITKKKRRLEEWDAKGGFTLWRKGSSLFSAKAITDLSMAKLVGVEVDDGVMSKLHKKRSVTTGPPSPTATWSLKRIKCSPPEPVTTGDTVAVTRDCDTPMANNDTAEAGQLSVLPADVSRDVTDPDQSPMDQ